ncbi:MAG: hypothetical protein ACYTFK_04900 [Planctomycetota bacterium]
MRKLNFTTTAILLICISSGCANTAGEAVAAASGFNNGPETNTSRQLRIYRDALFSGASEQSRQDAAVELLLRDDKVSREILLGALLSKENDAARQAVCRGLISCRALGTIVRNRNDFREGLFAILVDEEGLDAQLAAEALLVFKYDEISSRLERLARSGEVGRQIRLNVIYALKIRPGKEAMSELIRLLDDMDVEVAAAAESALQDTFGIPVGTQKEVWNKILNDLQRKSPDEIRRERLLQQETRMRKLQGDLAQWRKLYLAGLDKEYEGIDEEARGDILFERLASELIEVRLWALDKISRRSAGTVGAEFGARLVGLISDEDRRVRLETARVLFKMSPLNPAEELLRQFGAEKYDDVRLAMFEALGEACYYAFSPGSEIELSEEVRNKTLELAAGYIIEPDGQKAGKGAEVIRKLVELGGLDDARARKYLGLVADRYDQAGDEEEEVLRGELLGVMAILCGNGSYYRLTASELFEEIFLQGLEVQNEDAVRTASVTGLINIDGVKALGVFKGQGLANDPGTSVREAVIKLAARVGKEQDVEWLAEKADSNGQGQIALEAISAILGRESAAVAARWAEQLSWDGLGNEQVRTLFEMAEKKAETAEADEILWSVRESLVKLYLKADDAKQVGRVIAARLSEQDLGAEDVLAEHIEAYLKREEVGQEAKEALVGVLEGLETGAQAEARTNWTRQIKAWRALL